MDSELQAVLADIKTQLAALSERVAKLEGVGQASQPVRTTQPVPTAATPPAQAQRPVLQEEELLAISAALAAYLGVRVHIRQIRLIGSRAWSQQGRVWIQASHTLER